MISPCQVADYWSLHLLDLNYTDHRQVLSDSQSSNPTDWPLPMDYR